jgi:hypothetical protein
LSSRPKRTGFLPIFSDDGEGNRTKRTEISTGKVTEYDWDYRNRLTAVAFKDAAGVVTKSIEYTYDVDNQRIGKKVDGAVGRFVSEDPIGFAAGDSNIYRYVGNSPTNFVDPSGNVGNNVNPLSGIDLNCVAQAPKKEDPCSKSLIDPKIFNNFINAIKSYDNDEKNFKLKNVSILNTKLKLKKFLIIQQTD